ncbi:MAG TPA: preprotein translocase subunit SecG [Gemmatimonadaceae bacterium]|jgi:preprotein translocase subunit SecG
MYTFLVVLLILDSLLLIAVVLMQAGQGGGMAATFGGASSSAGAIFGTRQAGNLLTKASWWCGGIFLGLAFALSLASTQSRQPKSILDQAFPTSQAPAPVSNPGAATNLPINSAPAAPTTTAPNTKAPATKTPPSGKKP